MTVPFVDSDGSDIPVEVRRSARARTMRLTVFSDGRVRVTLPDGMDESKILPFLKRHRTWILRTRLRFRRTASVRNTPDFFRHPVHLSLPLLGGDFPVRYEWRSCAWTGVHLDRKNACIIATGRVLSPSAVHEAFLDWLTHAAEDILKTRLDAQSARLKLPYRKLTVRTQERRWGSCSSNRDISLNARLLFLPEDLVEYVLVHELCHLLEMNHGPAFRRLTEQFCPDCAKRRARLRALERRGFPPL